MALFIASMMLFDHNVPIKLKDKAMDYGTMKMTEGKYKYGTFFWWWTS